MIHPAGIAMTDAMTTDPKVKSRCCMIAVGSGSPFGHSAGEKIQANASRKKFTPSPPAERDRSPQADSAPPSPPPAAPPGASSPSIDLLGDDSLEAEVLDDDAFFATLREAVHDETPLGPREDDDERMSFFEDETDDDRASFRDVFRRRR